LGCDAGNRARDEQPRVIKASRLERSNIKAFCLSKWVRIRDLCLDGEDSVDFGRADDG